MQLISKIKNAANDVVPTIRIHSLLVYKLHLDLMTSCKFLIIMTHSLVTLSKKPKHNDTWHNDTQNNDTEHN